MPKRINIKGDLGTTKVASDSYDIDNVYFTEEGWVYRHYKKADKSKWWDEIIVAGQVPTTEHNVVETNPPKLGTHGMEKPDGSGDLYAPEPTFEGAVSGDNLKDFEYSPIYAKGVAMGGGVPNLDSTGDDSGDSETGLLGPITALAIVNGGTGYTTANGVALSGGYGENATADIVATAIEADGSGGVVTGVTIINQGTGYAENDTLTITGGDGNATVINTNAF